MTLEKEKAERESMMQTLLQPGFKQTYPGTSTTNTKTQVKNTTSNITGQQQQLLAIEENYEGKK